jgi:hypothetical protein
MRGRTSLNSQMPADLDYLRNTQQKPTAAEEARVLQTTKEDQHQAFWTAMLVTTKSQIYLHRGRCPSACSCSALLLCSLAIEIDIGVVLAAALDMNTVLRGGQ